ncbi:MAG: Hpt domain-containing protein, partial [Pseudomonadota bacterium]
MVDEEFDAEIMEIFVEDARDVLENINNKFIVWREDTENQNALTELRRGYHTLKGSGRMVGASEVAELSWSVENVLNRVREAKIIASPAIIELLEQMLKVLPRMIDVLAGGPPHGIDVEALREAAHALAQPGAVPATPTPASPATIPAGAPAPVVETGDLPKLEPTLLEIFTAEAQGNLANIRQQIAACREAGGTCFVSDTLYRSVHTLQGNARSLGLEVMSEPCAEIEKLLHALKSENIPLTERYLDLATRFEIAVSDLVERMNSGAISSGDLRRRFADLSRDLRAESTHLVRTDSAVETAAPTAEYVPEIELETPPETPAPDAPLEKEPTAEAAAFVPEPVARVESVVPAPPPVPAPTVATVPAVPVPPPAPAAAEQIDPELLEIFQEEATDILGSIEEALTRWR